MKKGFYSILATSALLLASAAATGEASAHVRQLKDRRRDKSGSSEDSSSSDEDGCCPDPAGAVLALLECVTNKDVACAATAYDPGFERYHNEIFTGEIAVSDPDFWDGALSFTDLSFEIKFSSNPGPNQASVRYIEDVVTTNGESLGLPASTEYPFSVTVVQHEHAIVTVDDDCKLVKWDQYGDDKEQTDVDDAVAALFCVLDSSQSCEES